MKNQLVIDFDEEEERRKLWNELRALRGLNRVEWRKYRPRRSDRQNRFYWPCFVEPLAQWMSEENGIHTTPDQAHHILKEQFLSHVHHDRKTGKNLTVIGSTAKLDTTQFNKYLDDCAEFLVEVCGFIVPDPSEYHESNSTDDELQFVKGLTCR